MKPTLNSLKARLLLWVLLPTVLISAADLLVSYRNADHLATLAQDQLLKGAARMIAEQLEQSGDSYEINVPPAAFELLANEDHDRLWLAVRGKNGLLVAGDGEMPAYAGELHAEEEHYENVLIRGEPTRMVAYKQAIPSTDKGDFGITQVAQTLRRHDALRRELFFSTMRQHLVLLTILVLGLLLAFRWIVGPFQRFSDAMNRRRPGSLEQFDMALVPGELKPMMAAMNDYVARLDHVHHAYEQFVTNTAHQLRTSFAILTSQINFARREQHQDSERDHVLQAIRKTVMQSTRVVNQLLVLAAMEQKRHERTAARPIALAPVVQSVMEELALVAQQKGIDLGIDEFDETLKVAASQTLLRELAANLVDNAIQHIGQGSVVTVSCGKQDGHAVLQVQDDGPGIPEAERAKVFQRYYRLNENKPNSSGLGLAIVKEICDSLGAAIRLEGGAGGTGLCVTVVFPPAAPA